NLGMALFTKPLGYYEEDSLTTAEPPGMGLIEEPVVVDGIATGSNQYGEWRESNGQSFWFYYAMYRLYGDLAGPRGYSYQDWRAYRDSPRGRPFYGRENQWGSYGPYTYSSSRYRDSDFIRRYPDAMTGARSPGTDSSIR